MDRKLRDMLIIIVIIIVIGIMVNQNNNFHEKVYGVWGTRSDDCHYSNDAIQCSFNENVKCSSIDIRGDDRLSISLTNIYKKIPSYMCNEIGGDCAYYDCRECYGPYTNAIYEVSVEEPFSKTPDVLWINEEGYQIHISVSQFREERPEICQSDDDYVTVKGYVYLKPIPKICIPNEAKCENNGVAKICSDTGDSWEYVYCLDNEACENGACVELKCDIYDKWVCENNTKNYQNYYATNHSCDSKITDIFDCNSLDEYIDEKFCDINNVKQKIKDYYCLKGECEYMVKDVTIQKCDACFQGECVDCNFDADCERLEICQNHECITIECKTALDCPSRTIENGKITAECLEYSCAYATKCNYGYSLYEGQCVFNWSPYILIGIIITAVFIVVIVLKTHVIHFNRPF